MPPGARPSMRTKGNLDGEVHALLEPQSRTYTSTAVQRAFVVWTVLGHVNEFRNVCDYFQRLEILEESFTPEQRKESRNYEYTLLTKQPPKSPYLLELFPYLYPTNEIPYRYPEEMKRGCKSFQVQGFNRTADRGSASTDDLIQTSQLIRNYCIAQKINIRDFLMEFHNFAKTNRVNPTVSNVVFYIQHRNVQQERQLIANYYAFDTRFLHSPPTQSYADLDLLPQYNQLQTQQTYGSTHAPINQQPHYHIVQENAIAPQIYPVIPLTFQQYNQPKVEIPLVIQQTKTYFCNDAAATENVVANNQLNTSAVNVSECGIDDVLSNITNVNNEYAKEINNYNGMPIRTKHKLATRENNVQRSEYDNVVRIPPNQFPDFVTHETESSENVSPDIFDHHHLLGLNAKGEVQDDKNHQVFSKKNKNQLIPVLVPMKKPTYCMKLKVKSKRSRKKAKQHRDISPQDDSFKSCELNMSVNLIDLNSSADGSRNISSDFARINDYRCSTSTQ